ncbi:G5-interacting protein [Trypanosoma brucei equiperdum]|uniref:G5-interacting protein n=1 Tax=Trypanosoma brucei equiperdum TaxID=630700 RepID=A0A3L6KZJ5_9TRYP|nr:G5-interacting protein [Trypanosoma brucei equiperdum]
MSLNPNAPPWNVPDHNMDHGMDPHGRHGHQDPRFHNFSGYYPQHIPMHQMQSVQNMGMPRSMMNHGYNHPAAHIHPMQHSAPPGQAFHQGRARGQAYLGGHVNAMPAVPAPSYRKQHIVVVVVLGYRCVGKTTVARQIAKVRNYRYVSLKPSEDAGSVSPEAFVAPVVELLASKNSYEGIVIDDIVSQNKYDPYYVQSVLQKHGLKLDVVVLLDSELDNAKEGVDYEDPQQRKLHPESYEFCACHLNGGNAVVVECRGKDLDETVAEAMRQLNDVNIVKESTITLKEVALMPNCPLVCNPSMVTEVLAAQSGVLGLAESASFPFSEPNYLLEYTIFARQAHAFRSYMIIPWIKGDKVSLIGYKDAIYLHLPAYNILFQLNDSPTALTHLLKETTATGGLAFIFEATFAANKLHVSDLLLLGGMKGSEMLVNERVDLLKEKLGELREGAVQLLPWYPVKDMEMCKKENPEADGILFVNPDGIQVGEYDSRNYLYPLHRKKTVELRIWNGNFTGGVWTFDAYCEEVGTEKLVEGIPVHINDDVVTEYCINDGNILECTREEQSVGTNKARKGGKHYVFKSRCQWASKPTTTYKQECFVNEPKWPSDRLAQACAAITYTPAVRREVQNEASG